MDSIVGIAAANVLGDKFLNITKGQSPETVKEGGEITPHAIPRDIPELLKQMATLLATFQSSVNRVDNLLAGVEASKGNLGKLLKDENPRSQHHQCHHRGRAEIAGGCAYREWHSE